MRLEDSSTYQLILTLGRLQGARRILVRMGRAKLGEPTSVQLAYFQRIADVERLAVALLDLSCWQDLLNVLWPPCPRRAPGKV